jgi:hypothetical protein
MAEDFRQLLEIPHLVNGDVSVADVVDQCATRICAIPADQIGAAYDSLDTGYDSSEHRRAADVRIATLEALVARRDGGYIHASYDVFVPYVGDTEYDRTRAALRRGLGIVAADDRRLQWGHAVMRRPSREKGGELARVRPVAARSRDSVAPTTDEPGFR